MCVHLGPSHKRARITELGVTLSLYRRARTEINNVASKQAWEMMNAKTISFWSISPSK